MNTLKECLKLLRPHQWLKNLLLYFPPFLGGSISAIAMAGFSSLRPFLAFCLASSSIYVVNDVLDRHNDAHHPKKRTRPVASGAIPVPVAVLLAALTAGGAVAVAVGMPAAFLLPLVIYYVISFAYSMSLKNVPIVDLFCISSGFLIRLHAGGAAFNVVVSPWLFLSVFLLSLFLSMGKRLGELQSLGVVAGSHRQTLTQYPPNFLEGAMYLTGSSVLVTYSIYVVSRGFLVYSVPLSCFGLLRYIFRVKSGQGGDPTDSLLKDPVLLVVGLSWGILMTVAVYLR